MRRALDWLYAASGAVGAASICAIALIVLAQVTLNVIDWFASLLTGKGLGLLIPSYATFAGYMLASATFFSLGYALRRGAHIRVSLVTQRLGPRASRVAEIIAGVSGSGIGLMLVHYLGEHAYDAWRFGDRSAGLVSVPLWIPQSVLVAGSAVFAIACIDTTVEALRGRASPAFAEDSAGEPAEIMDDV